MQFTGMKREKTLIFGGTFDPVHKGHLYLLKMAEEHTDYGRVVIIPARISNFKQGTHPASGEDRLKMLECAIGEYKEENPSSHIDIVISDMEIRREGVSYSYDTVREVIESYPIIGKPGFLMGDDLLSGLERWYRFDDLKKLVTFVCFTRGMHELSSDSGADIIYIPVEAYTASSSAVRDGERSTLTKGVAEYVQAHGLYKSL